MSDTSAEITRLLDLEAIRATKYRYLRALDQKLWDVLADCLTDDATAAYSGGAYSYEGRDAILEFLRRTMGSETVLSSHRCTQPEITFETAGRARCSWALNDVVILTELDLMVHGAAFYDDVVVRTDAGWRIAHTSYRRTYEQIVPLASIEGARITASWWGTDGRSTLGEG